MNGRDDHAQHDASAPAFTGPISAPTKFTLFGASTTFTLGYALKPGEAVRRPKCPSVGGPGAYDSAPRAPPTFTADDVSLDRLLTRCCTSWIP